MNSPDKSNSSRETIRNLVIECIATHNEEILIELIYRLQKEYIDIANLSSYGEYKPYWTHDQLLNYITYET